MKNTNTKGFTLVELMISLGIIVAISGITLFQYRTYSNKTTIRGLTHEVALGLREAQVNATNGKEFAPGTNEFRLQYGIHFVKGAAGAASTFNMYADRNRDNILLTTGAAATNELLAQNTLRKGYSFSICVKNNEADVACVTPAPTQLVVLYNFGNFKAIIKNANTGTATTIPSGSAVVYPYAEIHIYKDTDTATVEKVKLWSVGRIEN